MDKKNLIERNFTYHAPRGSEIVDKFNSIRDESKKLALLLVDICPESRELSVALTNLEQVMFWANACLVRKQVDEDAGGLPNSSPM